MEEKRTRRRMTRAEREALEEQERLRQARIRRERQRRRRIRQRNRRMLIGGAAVFVLIVIAAVAAAKSGKRGTQAPPEKSQVSDVSALGESGEITSNPEEISAAEPVETKVTISAAGDCTLGKDENAAYSTSLNAMYEEEGAAYFFKNVKSIFSADDLTLVNLEGTFTTETTRADKTFAFKADPAYVQILTEGSVEAVNTANNHSHDYGEQSYTDTIKAVEEAGIVYSGYDKVAIEEKNGIKIGMTGIYLLNGMDGMEEQMKNNMDELRAQGADLVIVSFHWGSERVNWPNENQTYMAHAAIDYGADLVLGHHPHVLQGVEKYKGKYICYSLGNFCFGGNKNPDDKDTMIFQQTFTFLDGELQPDDEISIIPCKISSVDSRNNYQPTPAEGDEAERINDKIKGFSEEFEESPF